MSLSTMLSKFYLLNMDMLLLTSSQGFLYI